MGNGERQIRCAAAPAAIGPYSQAIRAGGMVFVSGQIALDPGTGALTPGGAGEQARRCLSNLGAILKEAGLSFADVVKTTVFLTDLAAFAEVNTVYAEFFPAPAPARSTVQVSALPKGALVEIEAIGVRS